MFGFIHRHATMTWYMLDIVVGLGLIGSATFWVVGVKKKNLNRLHDAIVPYIAENLQPYVMQPPIQSCGD